MARPEFVVPQLASLREQPPDGDYWLHELKYDGYRIQALIERGAVRLMTRNKQNWTDRYPHLASALSALQLQSAVIDGELIAPDGKGAGNFGKLQQAAGRRDAVLIYYAFDLLYLNGRDLRCDALEDRKKCLKRIVEAAGDPLRFSDHIQGHGRQVFAQACEMKLEGIISKKKSAPYLSGRSPAWIKTKCLNTDEFIIGGYRKSDRPRRPFASLLLGEYEGGRLAYRGRVGTGFEETALHELATRMAPLKQETSSFRDVPAAARQGAVWLKPELVAQIRYAERTADGRLRHPRFLGLREDKPPREVTATPWDVGPGTAVVEGVRLTHPDRVMYPGQGVTKRQLAHHYATQGKRILPFLSGRPVSLLRCPKGRGGNCFFQKHHNASVPGELKTVLIEEEGGQQASYLLIDSVQGLIAAAQIGALELHIWGARADRIERPERLVFDLDPDESLEFSEVRAAAEELRDVLAAAHLTSFALLTGGKGIHVVAPIMRRHGWTEIKRFTRGLAHKLAEAAPGRYVAEPSKARRRGKIYIDWLRNDRGATAIAPYSPRARPGAPVATPVSWSELSSLDSAATYTMDTIRGRLSHLTADPWQGYHQVRQSITRGHLDFVA